MLVRKRFKKISPELYRETWHRWGGSFITHPNVLSVLEEMVQLPVEYFGLYHDDRLVGAVPAWDQWVAGHKEALNGETEKRWYRMDVGQPEFILPISPSETVRLPFRAKRLSELHSKQMHHLNVFSGSPNPFHVLAKPHGGPNGLSKKTIKKLKQKVTRIVAAGGEIVSLSALDPHEIAAAYGELYSLRWNGSKPQGFNDFSTILQRWKHMVFGNCIRFNGRIVALDINYKVTSLRCCYVEAVQGAWDPAYSELSPGTALMYLNTRDAWMEAQNANIPLRFSFGYTGNYDSYKDIWFSHHPLYDNKFPNHKPFKNVIDRAYKIGQTDIKVLLKYAMGFLIPSIINRSPRL